MGFSRLGLTRRTTAILAVAARNSPLTVLEKGVCKSVIDPVDTTRHLALWGKTAMIPDDTASFTLSIDRTSLPATSANVLTCQAEISLNGGNTWQLLIGFPTNGGDSGSPLSSATPNIVPSGTNRRVRTILIPFEDVNTDVKILCE